MRVYSAGEAIGPAWEHTKALMWADRRWGRLLKLSLVALGAEMGSMFSVNNVNRVRHPGTASAAAGFSVAAGLVLLAVLLAVYLVLLYLGSRLQLVQFDTLVLRDPAVAPAWHRHGGQTWRWAGIKATILVACLLVLSPLLVPAMPIFAALSREAHPSQGTLPGQLPAVHFMTLSVLFVEVLAVFILVAFAIRFVTSLVLPGVALEDLRFGAAFQRAWQVFRSDVPGMLWFAVLQPLFTMLLSLGVGMALFVLVLVLALPVGLVLFLVFHGAHSPGVGTWILLGTVGALVAILLAAIVLCAYTAVSGTLLMFGRAWSLYFLGGRYPLLGQYLEPSVAVPVWTPPPSLPRDEDDDDGPVFPADPALA